LGDLKNSTISFSFTMSFKNKDYLKDILSTNLSLKGNPIWFWHNRIGLSYSFDSTFNYNFQNKYSSSLTASFGFDFVIAQFFSLRFSVNSENNSFYKYYENEEFKTSLMLKDLLRSFDFFNNGRYNTAFNLKNISLEVIHEMEDWNLVFKYSGYIDSSKSQLPTWAREVTVYVKWNAIPELKLQGKRNNDGVWSSGN
ncbi:MAG: hypothetical protein HUK24_02895, partial [Sphaerochaetaceae bacterium]|nr:hypothetical protein [Sphaerochaetaceae bacterium]